MIAEYCRSKKEVARTPLISVRKLILSPKWVPSIAFAVVALFPLITWWRGAQLVWGLDGTFPIRLDEIGRYFHLGTTAYLPADARKISFLIPWGVFLYLWHITGLPWSAEVAQRLYTVSLIFISGASMRGLVRNWFPGIGNLGSTAAGLFYQVNVFCITTIWTSQSLLTQHYSLLPLLLLVITKSLSQLRVRSLLLASLGWTVMMTPAYITTPLVLVDSIIVALLGFAIFRTGRTSLFGLLKGLGIIFGGWLVLNLFWLIPEALYYSSTFASGIASLGGATSLSVFKLNSVTFDEALRLGGYWGLTANLDGSYFYPWGSWESGWINTIAYLPMCFAVIGMARYAFGRVGDLSEKKNHIAPFLTLVSVFFLLAATGSNPPVGTFTVHFLQFLHLLDPFRSTYQRAMEYLTLMLAPLLGLGIDYLSKGLDFGKLRGRLGIVTLNALIFLMVVVVPLPYWTGQLFDASGSLPSNRISIPQSYYSVAEIVSNSAQRASVLTLPIGESPVTYLDWRQGFQGIQPLSLMTSVPVIDSAPVGSYFRSSLLKAMASTVNFCNFLTKFNIDNVVWEKDANENLMNLVHGFVGTQLSSTGALLEEAPCLRKQEDSKNLVEFKNLFWYPRLVYFQSNLGSGSTSRAQYEIGNADTVIVTPPRNGYRYVTLNTPFDSNWRLNGVSPIGGGNVTIFRIRNIEGSPLVLTNVASNYLQRLLYLTLVLIVVLAFPRSILRWMFRRGRMKKVESEEMDDSRYHEGTV